MKTKVLSLAFVALSTTAFGQFAQVNNLGKGEMREALLKESITLSENKAQVNMSMSEKGLLPVIAAGTAAYSRPVGSFYMGINKQGQSYKSTILYLPAFTDVKFLNQSSEVASTTWTLETPAGSKPLDEFVDAEHNLLLSYVVNAKGYMSALPTVHLGNSQFTLGQDNQDGSGIMTRGDLENPLGACDVSGGSLYTGMQGGGYCFGSDVLDNTETAECNALYTFYNTPAVPLYITTTWILCVSDSNQPIAEGKTLTLKFKGVAEDGFPSDEVFYEMTATASDVEEAFKFKEGASAYAINFSKKTIDPLTGLEIPDPFTIDKAFWCEITGIDQDGVDVGVMGVSATNGEQVNSRFTFPNEEDKYWGYLSQEGSPGLNMTMFFEGMYNVVKVSEETTPRCRFASRSGMYNVVKVSEETTDLTAPDEGGYALTADGSGVVVFTTLDWQNEAGEDNIWLEGELPDWLQLEYDESQREQYGAYILGFKADPLPDGVRGRIATVRLASYGVTSLPITIKQGPDGISSTQASEVKVINNSGNLELTYPAGVTSVEIVNAAGQLVGNYALEGTSYVIPAANLAQGLYILKFNGETTSTVKVIK